MWEVRGFEVRCWMRIDLLQTIDHARLVPGLILFLRGSVSGGCYAIFSLLNCLTLYFFLDEQRPAFYEVWKG